MGVWDKTTPAGSDNARDGDDRIRELKDALEEALSHEDSTFPGATPGSTPIFIPGFLRGGTASRPTGDSLVEGRLYLNTDTNVIERYNGATWDTVQTAPGDDTVTGAKIADDQVDSEHYVAGSIDNEHLADSAVDTDEIADSAVETAKINDDAVTPAKTGGFGKVVAYVSSNKENVTGDGTAINPVTMDAEEIDDDSENVSGTITVGAAGDYLIIGQVTFRDAHAASCTHAAMYIDINSGTKKILAETGISAGGTGDVTLSTQYFGRLSASDTITLYADASGGSKTVDIVGDGGGANRETFICLIRLSDH